MFLTDVLLFTHLLHLPIGHMRQKPISYEYTPCVVSRILAFGYDL